MNDPEFWQSELLKEFFNSILTTVDQTIETNDNLKVAYWENRLNGEKLHILIQWPFVLSYLKLLGGYFSTAKSTNDFLREKK